MKVLVQWARRNPQDWQAIEPASWGALPKRGIPASGELGGQDNQPGWISELNCQGVHFNGFDHVAIEAVFIGAEEGVRITGWNDDPDDWPVGERQARVWTFLPLAPDPTLGFAINTRQSQVVYAEGERFAQLEANLPQNTSVRPWAEFVPPAESITRHGIWMEDAKFREHRDATNSFLPRGNGKHWGWEHWCDHLPERETEPDPHLPGRRRLKEQRAQGRWHQASRTITYYQRDTDRATVAIVCTNEDALEKTTGGSATESVTTNSGSVQSWAFTTDVSEPNSADWPNGDYHAQLNCTAASTGLVYGMGATADTQDGFMRLTSTTGYVEGTNPTNGNGDGNDFSGTGLKLATATKDFAAGAADNRFEVNVRATGDSHGDAITLTLNTTDSYADGPWTAGAVITLDVATAAAVQTTNTKDAASAAAVSRTETKDAASAAALSMTALQSVASEASIVLQGSVDAATAAVVSTTNLQNVASAAAVARTEAKDATTDAVLGLIESLDVATAAAVVTTNLQDVASQAILTRTEQQNVSTEAALSQTATRDTGTEAALSMAATRDAATDASIEVTAVHQQDVSTEAVLTRTEVQNAATEAVLTRTETKDVSSAASLVLIGEQNISTQAVLTRTEQQDASSEASITISPNANVSTEAAVSHTESRDAASAAALSLTALQSVATEAVIVMVGERDITSAAAVSATALANVGSEAVLARTETKNMSSEGALSATGLRDAATAASIGFVVDLDAATEAALAVQAAADILSTAALSRTGSVDVGTAASISVFGLLSALKATALDVPAYKRTGLDRPMLTGEGLDVATIKRRGFS